MAPRRQPSSIDKLPPEIRDLIARLRQDQGRSIDEILDHLRQLDVEVSRSALGRHVKSMAEIGEQLRRSETMARFVVEKFGEDTDDRAARASMRILQGALLDILTEDRTDEDGAPVTLSAAEAKEISLALQRLVNAQATDTQRQLKMRAEFAKTAAAAAEKEAKAQGMSADTIGLIRSAILGTASG